MIDKIAYELVKDVASNVQFSDKWAGLVRPLRKRVQNTNTVFPVAINVPDNCDQSDYTALIPDSSKKSVIYAELINRPEVEVIRHGSMQMASTIRLVVWYNLDLITEGQYVTEDVLASEVLDVLPKKLADSLFTGAKQVHIQPVSILYGSDIVSAYTYNEIKTQFAIHPYGIFAIDVDVWYISVNCQTPIVPLEGCMTGVGKHETI